MLYPTHKRYGILSGIITIPAVVSLGFLPTLKTGFTTGDLTYVLLGTYIGMRGALFGAEFPDCDSYGGLQYEKNGKPKLDENGNQKVSKGSIPAQKHPIISNIFRACGVKHRGKFSHDFASQLAFWGVIYLITYGITQYLLEISLTMNPILSLLINISSLVGIWMISIDMVDMINNLSDFITGKHKKKKKKETWNIDSNRFFKGLVIFIFLAIIMFISGNLSITASPSSTLRTTILWSTLLKIYIIFILTGVYSHLIADMMTQDGVNLFGKRLHPAKTLLKLKKLFFIFPLIFTGVGYFYAQKNGAIIGFLLGCGVHYMLISTDLKTGSKYEDICRTAVTILCIPATMLALAVIFGGAL